MAFYGKAKRRKNAFLSPISVIQIDIDS